MIYSECGLFLTILSTLLTGNVNNIINTVGRQRRFFILFCGILLYPHEDIDKSSFYVPQKTLLGF